MDEDEYIQFNHGYRLLVVASNIQEGIKDIIDEFEENWKEFVEDDENNISGDAIELRKRFSSIVSLENSP